MYAGCMCATYKLCELDSTKRCVGKSAVKRPNPSFVSCEIPCPVIALIHLLNLSTIKNYRRRSGVRYLEMASVVLAWLGPAQDRAPPY